VQCNKVRIDQKNTLPRCVVDLTVPGAVLTYPDDNGLLAGKYAQLTFKAMNLKLKDYTINGSIRPGMRGMPNLPFVRFQVRIPASVTKVTVQAAQTAFKAVDGEYVIAPVQEDLPESFFYGVDRDYRTFTIDNRIYGTDAFYSYPVEYEIGVCHGMKILEVRYSPVQYNPVTKELTVTDRAQIVVTYLDGVLNEPNTPNAFTSVVNSATYDGINGALDHAPAEKLPRGGKVVVVSKPAFFAMQTYTRWKTYRQGQGYEFVEEINADGMSATQITSRLKAIYDGTDRMQYVIVLGDETVIPIPTDGTYYHYKNYARLDSTDDIEDVCLGIFLCDNEERFANIVQHQMWHEQGVSWSNTVMMAAGMEGTSTTWDRFSSGHYSSIYLDNPDGGLGYTVKRVYKVPRIPTRYGGSSCNIPYADFELWTLDPAPFFINAVDATNKVAEYWNGGLALIGHRDHGLDSGTVTPAIRYTIFADTITSQASPFFTCLNCLTGNFKNKHDVNFAYQAQSSTYGTSVILSATRTTYSGDNDYFHLGLWACMFPKDGNRGERNIGKIWLTGHLSAKNHARTYFHTYGDPMTELTMDAATPVSTNAQKQPPAFSLRVHGARIHFQVPGNGRAHSRVSLKLYNVQGKMVHTLADGFFATGSHTVSLDNLNGKNAHAAGLYLCRMESGNFGRTIPLVLKK